MSATRKQLIDGIFKALDKSGSGQLSAAFLHTLYDPSQHPDVLAKKYTAAEAMNKMISSFDYGLDRSGMISYNEFLNYYTHVSVTIDKDEYFELLLRQVWGVNELAILSTQSSTANSVSGGNAVYRPPNLLNQLIGKKDTAVATTLATSTQLASQIGTDTQPTQQEIAQAGPDAPNSSISASKLKSQSQPLPADQPSPGISLVLSKINSDVRAMGMYGFVDLQRLFWANDTNGDGSLDIAEFKSILKCDELGLTIETRDITNLFNYFDINKDGKISLDEFISKVREPLSDTRLLIVHTAFDQLDPQRRGQVSLKDIANAYDSSSHPEVPYILCYVYIDTKLLVIVN